MLVKKDLVKARRGALVMLRQDFKGRLTIRVMIKINSMEIKWILTCKMFKIFMKAYKTSVIASRR